MRDLDAIVVCGFASPAPPYRIVVDSQGKSNKPFLIGESVEFTPKSGGVLLLRVNAPAGNRNSGKIKVVISGQVQGRQSAEEITIFKSLGMAVEDVAAAHLAWQHASERGLGRGFVL